MRSTAACAIALIWIGGCASKKDSAPPNIPVDVEFPSQQAALVTDSVKIYAFPGALTCTDLVRLRVSSQPFPASVVETAPLSPCELYSGSAPALNLPLGEDYTFLAVGQIAGKDTFIGCSVQKDYGTTLGLPIPLTFIDEKQAITPVTCAHLSDKCRGACP